MSLGGANTCVRLLPFALCISLGCLVATGAQARTLAIDPEHGGVIGAASTVTLSQTESLRDIAVRHRIGLDALVAANPKLTVSTQTALLPGTRLTLPTRHVLPDIEPRGIVVNLAELRLYYFSPDGHEVSVYPIGIGREGWSTPELKSTVSEIREHPSWTPPASIRNEASKSGVTLPAVVPPGPDNPLGEYAIRLGHTNYLIHGSNEVFGIGQRVSHGCLRMYPEHIEDLVERVSVGTPVTIVNQPVKFGKLRDGWVIEAHQPLQAEVDKLGPRVAARLKQLERSHGRAARLKISAYAASQITAGTLFTGLPMRVSDAGDTSTVR